MTATQALVASGFAIVAAVTYGWLKARAEVRRLRDHAERAAAELQRLQMAFARFAPESVVERIAAEGLTTAAATREVTVLFADLVGFTRLGEQLAPDVLVRLLNDYFARMSRVITEHRGHVSKFIGDGLMALFGVPEANPWQANDAVHAALAMRDELARYNADLQRDGLPSLRVGIGIHRGPVVAGVVGSPALLEYTVIGNTVNVAARIEGLTRVHGVDILVSAAVHSALDPRVVVEPLPAVRVAGVSEPVATYAVKGFGA